MSIGRDGQLHTLPSTTNEMISISTLQTFRSWEYEKRLLLICIHHFDSDVINNMDHMRISGT